MRKITLKTVKKEEYIYDFYCDRCEKKILTTYADWETPSEVYANINIKGEWYENNQTLCEECKNKFYEDLIQSLQKLGFNPK